MAEVAECKTSISNLEREEKEAAEGLNKLLAQIPNLPLTKCLMARTRRITLSVTNTAKARVKFEAICNQSNISTSAKRWAKWISKLRRSSPARVLSF